MNKYENLLKVREALLNADTNCFSSALFMLIDCMVDADGRKITEVYDDVRVSLTTDHLVFTSELTGEVLLAFDIYHG